MAEEVIVFDCEDELSSPISKEREDYLPSASTNVYGNEQLRNRYADMLKLKKTKVKSKENSNNYDAPK